MVLKVSVSKLRQLLIARKAEVTYANEIPNNVQAADPQLWIILLN